MAKLPRYSLSHNEKTKKWELKKEGSGEVVKRFASKAAATKGGVLEKAVGGMGSVKNQEARRQDPRRAHLSAQHGSARAGLSLSQPSAFGMAEAGRQMVVDHADALHEGMQCRRSAEAKAVAL